MENKQKINTTGKNLNMASAMLAGRDVGTRQKLSAATQAKLKELYFNLYFGLAGTNWARGGTTLGVAWQSALGQIEQYINAQDKNSSATQFLRSLHTAHRKNWSRVIMTSRHAGEILGLDTKLTGIWKNLFSNLTNKSLSNMRTIMAQYKTINIQRGVGMNQQANIIQMFIKKQHGIRSA